MNTRVLLRLMWKDARSVRPLLIAIPCMILVFYALLVILDISLQLDDERLALAVTILWSVPLLIAFASPAMLVGGEDEGGSLAWLQTLPTNWKQISLSKLLVTLLSTISAWLLGLICFAMYCSSVGLLENFSPAASQSASDPLWTMLLIGFGISLWVILSSFCTSYLFRSPITALLLVLPTMFALMIASSLLMEWTLGPTRRLTWDYLDVGTVAILVATFGGLTLVLFVSYFVTAWWRLSNQKPTFFRKRVPNINQDAYRPPLPAVGERMVRAISGERPSQWYALLWSQIRPIRFVISALLVLGCLTTWLALTATDGFEILSAFVAGLVVFVLGSLTFYGDSVKQRCRFFADRGISPSQIWLTRVVPIALALLMIFVVGVLVQASEQSFLVETFGGFDVTSLTFNLFAIATAVFGLTQLVSQWSPRPALAFFAAPPFTYICSIALFIVLNFYTAAIPILFVSAVILFFASWRLTPLWLEGEKGKPYVLPFLGYTAAAIFVPILLIFATRWITMPAVDGQWRERMMTMELPSGDSADKSLSVNLQAIGSKSQAESFLSVDADKQDELIAAELADTDSLGQHVSFNSLVLLLERSALLWGTAQGNDLYSTVVNQTDKSAPIDPPIHFVKTRKRQLDAARVLLRWASVIRKDVIAGKQNFPALIQIAHRADRAVVLYLNQLTNYEGLRDETAELIRQLPQQETINEARRIGLIRNWRRLKKNRSFGLDRFGVAYRNPPNQWWQFIERKRSDRFLDALLKQLQDNWANRVSYLDPKALDHIRHLEAEAYLSRPSQSALSQEPRAISGWLQRSAVFDQNIKNLRERVLTK